MTIVYNDLLGGVEFNVKPGTSTWTREALNEIAHADYSSFDGGTLVVAALNGRFRLQALPGSEDHDKGTIDVSVTAEVSPESGWKVESTSEGGTCEYCDRVFGPDESALAAAHYGETGHVVEWRSARKVWIGRRPDET